MSKIPAQHSSFIDQDVAQGTPRYSYNHQANTNCQELKHREKGIEHGEYFFVKLGGRQQRPPCSCRRSSGSFYNWCHEFVCTLDHHVQHSSSCSFPNIMCKQYTSNALVNVQLRQGWMAFVSHIQNRRRRQNDLRSRRRRYNSPKTETPQAAG